MSAKTYFTKGGLKFLTDLREHNDRDWFQANKRRFEEDVRDPFLRFITDLGPVFKKIAPDFVVDPSPNGGSMMRIYRDIRFSKDKSPYKTHVAAHFRHARGKEGSSPAYYLRFEPGSSAIGGGIWEPESKALKKIRDGIVSDPSAWRRATPEPGLGAVCSMSGQTLKRAPAGYDPSHPLIEDIKRKDFAASTNLKDSEVTSPDLIDMTSDRIRSLAPFMRFLSKALGLAAG